MIFNYSIILNFLIAAGIYLFLLIDEFNRFQWTQLFNKNTEYRITLVFFCTSYYSVISGLIWLATPTN